MTHFYAVDSSGTTRLVRRFFAVDSGGTSRMIKRGFVIDSSGAARLFFLGGYSFTITALVGGSGNVNTGYSNGLGTGGGVYGSISSPPSGDLPSGKIIAAVYDNSVSSGANFVISATTDPTQSSLIEVILNGHTYSGSSATYSYGAGSAHWSWGSGNSYGLVNGQTYTGLAVSSGAW